MKKTAWRIVLVRPRNPLNIGAAARALANFGFNELVLVRPHDPVWQEARSAVGASQILKSARAVNDFVEAVADCTLVVGTTTGSRRNLDLQPLSLTAFTEKLRELPVHSGAALLFGSEKTGLSNEQLSYCHFLVRVPTTANCPSMNLGQAVAVCCYELARAARFPKAKAPPRVHASPPASVQSLDHILDRMVRLLDYAGYFNPKARSVQITRLRRLLLELQLSNYDVRVLGGILAQMEWKTRSHE
jgi:TrmH family RNA methyltransferase